MVSASTADVEVLTMLTFLLPVYFRVSPYFHVYLILLFQLIAKCQMHMQCATSK